MSTSHTESLKTRLENVIALARLLERIERTPRTIGAEQYRGLVQKLQEAIGDHLPEPALQAVLGAHPATAELYENLHYGESGLSQSSLERSVSSEMLASQAIARAAREG
jgi:hypothetical protein